MENKNSKNKIKEDVSQMFNIYYINYAKAFEIAMLIDNRILDTITNEKGYESIGAGKMNAGAGLGEIQGMPIMPNFSVNGDFSRSKSGKIIDTVKVVTTKSIILRKIYEKAENIKDFSNIKQGHLIKVNNVSLEVNNKDEIKGIKALLSGFLSKADIDGIGVNIATLFEVVFKDAAYIINGFMTENKCNNTVVIRIPAQVENEFENQYSICDLEVGTVTLIGIYRGKYKRDELEKKLGFSNIKHDCNNSLDSMGIIIEGGEDDNEMNTVNQHEDVHFVDVISIVQDICL